jgi:hypothetical protein
LRDRGIRPCCTASTSSGDIDVHCRRIGEGRCNEGWQSRLRFVPCWRPEAICVFIASIIGAIAALLHFVCVGEIRLDPGCLAASEPELQLLRLCHGRCRLCLRDAGAASRMDRRMSAFAER